MDGKIFTIYNKGTNNYLSVADSYDYEKQNIIVHNTYTLSDVATYTGSSSLSPKNLNVLENLKAGQQFRMRYSTQRQTYTIAPISSMNGSVKSRILNVKLNSNGILATGCNVNIAAPFDDADTTNEIKNAQCFDVIPCGYGYYRISLKSNSNLTLTANAGNGADSNNSSTAIGNVYVSTYQNDNKQKWSFTEQTSAETIESYYATMNIRYPLDGVAHKAISSDYGLRQSTSNGVVSSNHGGIDIPASKGTLVRCAFDGVVVEVGPEATDDNEYNDGKGNYIIIEASSNDYNIYNNNSKKLHVVYMHLDECPYATNPQLRDNPNVNQGDIVGKVGKTGNSTGYHLHFGIIDDVQYNGSGKISTAAQCAIDPMYFFDDYGLYSGSTN
ncbi:MAG: M23 family metallopeptidase [Clostridia bacterium]|nr:M23 family metallopeptidase [Clostridia bacterium]